MRILLTSTQKQLRNKYQQTRTKSIVPWETLEVKEKRAYVKTASKCNRKNPTNINDLKLKKAQNELANLYLKQQTEYIQNQIDKIRDTVKDRQSKIAWQMINEVSRRKSTAKPKLKAPNNKNELNCGNNIPRIC